MVGESIVRCYRIPKDAIAISTENVHTNYRDIDSSVTFRISNGNLLRLIFPIKGECLLVPEAKRTAISSPKSFKAAFPITVAVVPVLGPLEHDEPRVKSETVQRNLHTTRASRHFRNYWMYNPENFEGFANLIEQTWPNMSITAPEDGGDVVHMFCNEERIPRELFWSGFGFQVWCQLLTHLDRGRGESIIVVDEPEIYLHPDLQRQLLDILFSLGPSIVMATHSAEIIGAADPRELVLIDKKARSGKRLATDETVQQVLDSIGSLHNVTLTRIAKHRRVLFVEGDDYPLFLKFAKIAGYKELATGTDLPAVPSDGFSNWTRVRDTAWGIRKILGGPFQMASILDRDFRSEEEVKAIRKSLESEISLALILRRKEIENYLLIPPVICNAINSGNQGKASSMKAGICTVGEVRDQLTAITDSLKGGISAQYSARRSDYLRKIKDKRDLATVIKETGDWFDEEWTTLEGRIRVSPGKEVLAKIREWAQNKFETSLTTSLMFSKMSSTDLAPDLRETLALLDEFRLTKSCDEITEG